MSLTTAITNHAERRETKVNFEQFQGCQAACPAVVLKPKAKRENCLTVWEFAPTLFGPIFMNYSTLA